MTCPSECDSLLLASKDTGVSNLATFSLFDKSYSPNGLEKNELLEYHNSQLTISGLNALPEPIESHNLF